MTLKNGGVTDTILKLIVGAALAAGIGWNTWLTSQIDDNKKELGIAAARLAANDVRFQYIAEALTDIRSAILTAKPEVKIVVPIVRKSAPESTDKHFDPFPTDKEKK